MGIANEESKSKRVSQFVEINDIQYRMKGAKVLFPSRTADEAYVYFAAEAQVAKPPRFPKHGNVPKNSLIVGVDLGWTNPAYCVTTHFGDKLSIISERNISLSTRLSDINKIYQQIAVKNKHTSHIASLLRRRHKSAHKNPAWGGASKKSCRTLHVRRTNILNDYAKKLAAAIVKEARVTCSASIEQRFIVIEDLKSLLPKVDQQKFVNKRLANMVAGKIKIAIKSAAAKYGIAVMEVNPFGTSQIHNRCGSIGVRYNERSGTVIRQKCGRLFACPVCGHYRENSDRNGALNLVQIILRKDWMKKWRDLGKGRKAIQDSVYDMIKSKIKGLSA